MIAILSLLALLVITGVGWFSARLTPTHENISHDNTYEWTEIFHGYEAYLDQRIFYSTVSGSSMEPTFGEGDAVLWVEVDNMAELKVGDIIIFQHPTLPGVDNIAHRIVEIVHVGEGYQFRTRGDDLSTLDQHLVPEGNVHGLVIGVIYSAISSGQP